MASSNKKNERLLTRIIIILSVAGVLYFGLRAVLENSEKNQENPFEYNIENFKKSDVELIQFGEVLLIELDFETNYGIAIGFDDKLFLTGHKSVCIYDKKGKILKTFSCGGTASCIAVDEENSSYLGMSDHVEVFDSAGVKKATWLSLGAKAILTSIAISAKNVYVADAGNQIVWKYDKEGNLLGKIGEKNAQKDIPGFLIPSPFFDVAIDPDGFLWVANTGRHSLENYTSDGDLRSSWGHYSMNIDGFCGCCNPSHIAILEDGSFVTSEKGIPRVKIYNRLGQLESLVALPAQFDEGTAGLDLAVDSHQRIYILDPKRKQIRIFDKKIEPDRGSKL
jgi:hypothetical protein